MRRLLFIMLNSLLNYHFGDEIFSIAYLLSESAHVYLILGLEVDVHSIWVLWTRQPS